MTEVAILCPGPSLATTPIRPSDFVIAVNGAAMVYACDFWACLDWVLIEKISHEVQRHGWPILLTQCDAADSLIRHGHRWPIVECVENILQGKPQYTLLAALGKAHSIIGGAPGRVTMYGVDWAGTKGFNENDKGENRSPARWSREEKMVRELVLTMFLPGVVYRGEHLL